MFFFFGGNTEKEKRGKVDNFYGWQRNFPSSLISVEVTSAILVCSQNVNAVTAVGVLMTLIDCLTPDDVTCQWGTRLFTVKMLRTITRYFL